MSKKINSKKADSYKFFKNILNNKEEIIELKADIIKHKKMIRYKKLQNIDLTLYDYIFLNRQFGNYKIDDFASFQRLLEEIKKKYKPNLLNFRNIENIKKEGKFSFDKYNLTKLIPFSDKIGNNIDISINDKYLETNDSKTEYTCFFLSKAIFKGKHCFELETLNLNVTLLNLGLVNINDINIIKKEIDNKLIYEYNTNILKSIDFDFYKLLNIIFIKKNNDNMYHHYTSYGDIFGFCFDFDKKFLNVYLKGELINTLALCLGINEINSYVPFFCLGKSTKIIFNPGENLKYGDIYKKMGYIPLDENKKNNLDISQLTKVTNDYIDILFNHGKDLINNKHITYSDINQIYHTIFDFLGNISFQYSCVVQKCFINNIVMNNSNDIDCEFYYICIKYILNSVKNQKYILKNIILNLVESIHIYLMKGNTSYHKLYELISYLFSKKDLVNIICTFSSNIIQKIFSQILIPFHPYYELFKNINLDSSINSKKNYISTNQNNNNYNKFIFKNIKTSFEAFMKNIIFAQNINEKQKSYKTFSNFVETILNYGVESENNKNKSNNIFNSFESFLQKEKEHFTNYHFSEKRLNKLFKSFFIPGMYLFNKSYNKINKENNLLSYSIKYFIENKSEKLGDSKLNEKLITDIPNFEEIANMKINNINNIFLIEFFDFFLCENIGYIWCNLNRLVQDEEEEFTYKSFYNSTKNDSFDTIHYKFIKFIKYKLSFLNLDDIEVILYFLINVANFLFNELYKKNLIYSLPEHIFYKFEKIISFLDIILNKFSPKNNDFLDDYLKYNEIDLEHAQKEKKNNLEELCKRCMSLYVKILIKIISDDNIEKVKFKCYMVEILLYNLSNESSYTNEQIIIIINFINKIDKNEYREYIFEFIEILDEKIITNNNFTQFGLRLSNIINDKKNINILKTLFKFLNSIIYYYLPELDEICYKCKLSEKSLVLDCTQKDNNNNEIDGHISKIDINESSNDFLKTEKTLNLFEDEYINSYFKNVNNYIIILIHFYKLTNNISDLYEFNEFGIKYIYDLLLSLYEHLIIHIKNIEKINANNIILLYVKICSNIFVLYHNIFFIISHLNYNIVKEMAKRRKIYHIKDIITCLSILIESQKVNNLINKFAIEKLKNCATFLNEFHAKLEKLIPEEETLINIQSK